MLTIGPGPRRGTPASGSLGVPATAPRGRGPGPDTSRPGPPHKGRTIRPRISVATGGTYDAYQWSRATPRNGVLRTARRKDRGPRPSDDEPARAPQGATRTFPHQHGYGRHVRCLPVDPGDAAGKGPARSAQRTGAPGPATTSRPGPHKGLPIRPHVSRATVGTGGKSQGGPQAPGPRRRPREAEESWGNEGS